MIIRDKYGHFIMIKGTLHQEDTTLFNIHTLNQGTPKYIKHLLTELKGETDKNTIIVGDLNTWVTALDTSSKQKINKGILALNDTLDQMDIIDIYREHPVIHSSPVHMEQSQG